MYILLICGVITVTLFLFLTPRYEVLNTELLRMNMDVSGYEHAKLFNWQSAIDKTLHIYSEVLTTSKCNKQANQC